MSAILVLIVAFVALYPAALVGGIVQGKLGPEYRQFRWVFCVISYFLIGGFAVSLVV
ncbi:hypothetical protein [uncultured Sulfitobacter sp.]|uniref:hypothetical protein n=1 Tax=uncultured Sulfitobacter sp. TaxID=191468 RepID=UPI00260488B1|nr:hypothetical protein [uncultured Sulfitobacter sp.]